MSTYTKTTNFTAKDNLTSGDPAKVIKGSEFDTEFIALETAVNSKADKNNGTHTGTTTIATADIDTLQIDSVAVTATAAEINTLDGITASTAELNITDGLTATTAELNTLDGITSTTAELNLLDGVTATTAELNILDGVTSTTAEINKLDGFTGTADDLNYAKDLRATGVTTAELDVLDGMTATTSELNILDGATVTTSELNILDGVTATASELNITDGLTATTAELNTLDGITATTTELNYTDGVTSNIQTQLNSMVEKAGDTMTGDLSMGDSVKAKFGASDDLQIYHDGSSNSSYIKETGAGSFQIEASNLFLKREGGTESFLDCVTNGAVTAYYDGSAKLTTTSTGVDVTGTVTADGLTVGDGSTGEHTIDLNGSGSSTSTTRIHFQGGGTGNPSTLLSHSASSKDFTISTGNLDAENTRFVIANNGDCLWYEDTGTTAKMTWSSSAERLTINGTSTPLDIKSPTQSISGGNSQVKIGSTDTAAAGKGGQLNFTANTVSIANYPVAGVHGYHETAGAGNYSGYLSMYTTSSGGGVTERMRIDSSGRVGIGTASPSEKLEVQENTNSTDVKIRLRSFNSSSAGRSAYISYDPDSRILGLGEGGDELNIDSSGIVSFSETSSASFPARSINAYNNGYMYVTGGTNGLILKDDDTNGSRLQIENSQIRIETNGSERARIDSSGNLLIGRTSSGITGNGHEIKGGDSARFSRDASGETVQIGRNANDGDLIRFYANGVQMGAISVAASNELVFSNGSNVGIRTEQSGDDRILPCGSNGTVRDNSINLGAPTERFGHLFLGGGVYLGGTGSANKLDDYEEGTWIPNLEFAGGNGTASWSLSVQAGEYTKIGNLVHFRLELRLSAFSKGSASGDLTIKGLPFASSPVYGEHYGVTFNSYNTPLPSSAGEYPIARILSSESRIRLQVIRNNDASSTFPDPDSDSQYKLAGFYTTNA